MLRVIDFGVKWKQLQAGEVLVREGQPSDGCLYVLLHGRARSSIRSSSGSGSSSSGSPPETPPEGEEREEEVVVVADHGRGTLIGETEVLTGGRHKATVQAVRYTSFATLPSSVLGLLIRRHPRVLATLAEHVVGKAAYTCGHGGGGRRPGGPHGPYGAAGQRRRRWTGEASAGLDVGVGVPPPQLFSVGAASSAAGAAASVGAGAGGSATTSPAGRAVIGDAGAKTILVLPAYVTVQWFNQSINYAHRQQHAPHPHLLPCIHYPITQINPGPSPSRSTSSARRSRRPWSRPATACGPSRATSRPRRWGCRRACSRTCRGSSRAWTRCCSRAG